MDVLSDVPVGAALDREFDQAFGLLNSLVDWRQVDEMMPLGPAAIYAASVVLWMLVYQRIHASASLQAAVKHLIEAPPLIAEQTAAGENPFRQHRRLQSGPSTAHSRSHPVVRQFGLRLADRRHLGRVGGSF